MRNQLLFLFLFCVGLFPNYAQNQPSPHKEKMEEFRTLFVQNIQIQSGSLSKYKNINFTIDDCTIEIKAIDYENSNDENSIISFPTSGAHLKENGEIYYKNKAIKEVIENKISKKIKTHFYRSSKKIGLFLKLENEEKYKIIQEKLNKLSNFCTLEILK